VKIYYRVSRLRLGWGSIPGSAFLHLRLNYSRPASDEWGCNREGSAICPNNSLKVLEESGQLSNSTFPVNIGRVSKQHEDRIAIDSANFIPRVESIGKLFHLLKISRLFAPSCKILKQLADRIKYNFDEDNSRKVKQTLNTKSECLSRVEFELSESEAKFFLDRISGTGNIDRKFFGDYFERAKFHLQAFGNLLNWRSYVLGWGGVSLYAHKSAWLRKAVSPKQGLSVLTNHQHQASGKKRLLGFFLFPANMEESELKYELESEERGRKGAWSYCVII